MTDTTHRIFIYLGNFIEKKESFNLKKNILVVYKLNLSSEILKVVKPGKQRLSNDPTSEGPDFITQFSSSIGPVNVDHRFGIFPSKEVPWN